MSALGIIVLVTWLVGGLALSIAMEVLWPTRQVVPAVRGLLVLVVWGGAPLVAAVALVFGLCWLLGHAVGRVERVRPSRETLERRIRELEDETGMGP
jgi:hypothetical protein